MKGILVVDMPSSCAMCEVRWSCKVYNKWKGYNDRLDGCPLKPMPQRKGKYGELNQYDTDIHYEIGWNECLEELEK